MGHSTFTLTPNWTIEQPSDHPTAQLAAEELQRTLQRIGGPALRLAPRASGMRLALTHGAEGDGFVRIADERGLRLHGDGPRGLLYAVYDLLEALGCRWIAPGVAGERLPRYERVQLPEIGVAQQPTMAWRGLIIGSDALLDQAEDWIVWAARNRLNALFIHTRRNPPFIGACRERRWIAQQPRLLPLIAARQMRLEIGGHLLDDLLPRKLFAQQPDLFRFDGQQRTPDHNLCPSNPSALAIIREQALAYARTFPAAEVYHLWPADLFAGGWCTCAACAEMSVSDQALRVANACAEAIASLKPNARVAYLAYHDTQLAPSTPPHPNLELLFAPRTRNYAHGIGDDSCARNRRVLADLQALSSLFPQRSVFEYYLDGILFKGAVPPLSATLRADVQAYHTAGVTCLYALATGLRSWASPPLNAFLFAKLTWDADLDAVSLIDEYAATRAPRAPHLLSAAYHELEQAWRAALDLAPEEAGNEQPPAPSGLDQALARVLPPWKQLAPSAPPTDVLDFMAAPRPLCEIRLERLHATREAIERGTQHWHELISQFAHSERPELEAERFEWAQAATLLRYFEQRQRLYVQAERHASKANLRETLRRAQAMVALLSDPPHQRGGGAALLRLLCRLQLERLADAHLYWPWQRLGVRAQIVGAALQALARLGR